MTGGRRAGLFALAVASLAAGTTLVYRGLNDETSQVAASPPAAVTTTAPPAPTTTTTTPPAGPTTAAPARALRPPDFVFPNGTTVEAALVQKMAALRDFGYLEEILGRYGIGVTVTETAGQASDVKAVFPPGATFDERGQMQVSEDLRGSTVEIVVVRQA